VGLIYGRTPLLYLARPDYSTHTEQLDRHEKIFLLLKSGADVAACYGYGESCLHRVLKFDADIPKEIFSAYQEEEFKDILMCMVTAGADVYASDDLGTASQIACEYGHEELWREVLAKCGYDPDEVFSIENEFKPRKFQGRPVIGIFPAAAPVVRSTMLSFAQYSRERKSLDCVQKVYRREDIDIKAAEREADQFWESIIESSDSEDYEWVSVEEGRRRRENRRRKKVRIMKMRTTAHDGHNSDNIAKGYPELLHDGVYWRNAFS
jgi:hypothetical protein